MIVQSYTEGYNNTIIHTKSDAGYYIRQIGTGAIYAEADDPVAANRQYEETDQLIENEKNNEET